MLIYQRTNFNLIEALKEPGLKHKRTLESYSLSSNPDCVSHGYGRTFAVSALSTCARLLFCHTGSLEPVFLFEKSLSVSGSKLQMKGSESQATVGPVNAAANVSFQG